MCYMKACMAGSELAGAGQLYQDTVQHGTTITALASDCEA